MKFREHRGHLEDSLSTMVELAPTMGALLTHLANSFASWSHLMPPISQITVKPYFADRPMPDPRIGWKDTFLVTLEGYGVIGMVDEMPT